MPNKAAILELLIELWDQGLLTGDNIALDGQGIALYSEPDRWRPDGYSVETSNGCRRHRLIDQYLDELAVGDRHERQVAENFPRWFAFGPKYPDLESTDEAERLQARRVVSTWGITAFHVMSGRGPLPAPFDFRIPLKNPSMWQHYEYHPEAAVILMAGRGDNAPELWPEQAIRLIDSAVERLRNPR